MSTKNVKVDGTVLEMARDVVIRKAAPRLAPKVSEGGSVGGFVDELFVREFGVGLHKLSDTELITAALTLVMEVAPEQPEGKTGLSILDNI